MPIYETKEYLHENGDHYAWICLGKEELDQLVPEHFPNSKGKTWGNYSTILEIDGNSFVIVGFRDENCNRKDRVTEEEFNLWKEHFKGRNIWTIAEAREYTKQFKPEGEDL